MEKKEIIMCSVGDMMLSDSPLFVGVGVGAAFPRIKGQLFHNCKAEFHLADIVIGNFESVVYHPKRKNLAELQMSCSEDAIKAVKAAGFSVLNLANNHCLQHGTKSFFYTKEVCENEGIHVIGVRDEAPYICEIDGFRIAFLSINLHTEWYQPNDIQFENDMDRVLNKIRMLRNNSQETIIVLSIHWEDEFATFPSNNQIELCHKFVDDGANIILGHHSHVFQGIETYNNALIVYSQGNFVSDMVPSICRETGIVKIIISNSGENRNFKYELIPYYINDRFIPELSDGKWFHIRQKELADALAGNYSDADYRKNVEMHHRSCSRDFRKRFIHSFYRYRLNVFFKMMLEFFGRKVKKFYR